jgi:hypothetical protein
LVIFTVRGFELSSRGVCTSITPSVNFAFTFSVSASAGR